MITDSREKLGILRRYIILSLRIVFNCTTVITVLIYMSRIHTCTFSSGKSLYDESPSKSYKKWR